MGITPRSALVLSRGRRRLRGAAQRAGRPRARRPARRSRSAWSNGAPRGRSACRRGPPFSVCRSRGGRAAVVRVGAISRPAASSCASSSGTTTSSASPATSDALASHPWWYYGPRFAFAFLPWTLLLVPLVAWGMRAGAWKRRPRVPLRRGVAGGDAGGAVGGAVQARGLPAAGVPRCGARARVRRRAVARVARGPAFGACARSGRSARLLAVAVAVWPVMWFVVEPAEAARQEKRPFAAAIRAHAPRPQTVLLFRTESHLLAYHLGPPLHTLVEWGELKDALNRPGPHVVVMPPEYAADAARITGRELVPVASLADFTACPPAPPAGVPPHRELDAPTPSRTYGQARCPARRRDRRPPHSTTPPRSSKRCCRRGARY